MSTIFGVPVDAAYYVVSSLAAALTPLTGGLAVAVAIVAFTVAVRLLLLPLSYYALRGQVAQSRLAPQLQALRQRHRGDPDRLTREAKALYRDHGTGKFAGYLPCRRSGRRCGDVLAVPLGHGRRRAQHPAAAPPVHRAVRCPLADRTRTAERAGCRLRRAVRSADRGRLPGRPRLAPAVPGFRGGAVPGSRLRGGAVPGCWPRGGRRPRLLGPRSRHPRGWLA